MSKTKKPPEPRTVKVVSSNYQPSRSELRDEVVPPADLMELPLKERLEEGARRLLEPVEIQRVERTPSE